VAFHSVRARTAYHLLALADRLIPEGHPIHQADVAAAVGSVREVVGRILLDFRRSKIIQVADGGIIAVEDVRLREVVSQDGNQLPIP
jgi:CRP-like cAMP-binding protein